MGEKIRVGVPGTTALALEIADESAISTIECSCIQVRSKSGAVLWYDMSCDKYDASYVERAARYLKMRGKLRIRKSNPDHVKPVQ